jgi:DNA-directed DNA polymerase III PolC
MADYTHLNVHSYYSMLSGVASPALLVKEAKRLSFDALALTDTNGMYGIVEFTKECFQSGIKPILGTQIITKNDNSKLLLIAKNNIGLEIINKIVTSRMLDDNFSIMELAKQKINDLFFITGDIEFLKNFDGDNIYFDICDKQNDIRAFRQNFSYVVEQHRPCIVTNNVHFIIKEEYDLHKILSAIRTNSTIYDLKESDTASLQHYMKSEAEIRKEYPDFGDAIFNTRFITQNCNVDLRLGNYKYPKYPLPQGESSFSLLWKLCFDGLSVRYHPITQEPLDRLRKELEIIEKLGFADYFLIVKDINEEAKKRGFKTIGRGSAANSIVSYVLGITHVDPIKYNLFFERFLNPERKSPPDIDLDFSWKDRDEILNYVYERYGNDKVAMISTHVTFAARSAVRETAKALGVGDDEISKVNKFIPHTSAENLPFLKEKYPECRKLPLDIEPWKSVIKYGTLLAHYPRHLSIHPSGIIVCPDELFKFTPLERSDKGYVVTQPDMYSTEELGLMKIDLLSQRALGVFQDVRNLVQDKLEIDIEDTNAVFADEQTKRIIRLGKSIGCFYIESPGMRSLLKKLGVDSFEMLTVASSIIRPGVAESGMMQEFILRHKDPARRVYKHPALEKLLSETYGVMVYQEDCIKVANAIANMPLSRADILRRAMSGKMRSYDAMRELKNEFLTGCKNNEVEESIANELWDQISSFAGYAFCKAHSASFAILSFQMAYLKAHYPAEFLAAVLSNQGGFYSPAVYIQEARRLGIKILLPCINKSNYEYSGRDNWIRIGFLQIKDLTKKAVDSIIEARKNIGQFSSLKDVIENTNIGFSDLNILIKCGAFDAFELTRPELLLRLKLLYKKSSPEHEPDMFSESRKNLASLVPRIPDYSIEEKCQIEYDYFGFMASLHPLEFFKSHLNAPGIIKAKDMHLHTEKIIKMIGWWVSEKRIKTKTGKFMKFLSLEDLTDTFEAVLFPEVYEKHAYLFHQPGPYLLEGKIEKNSVDTLIVRNVGIIKEASSPLNIKRIGNNFNDEDKFTNSD